MIKSPTSWSSARETELDGATRLSYTTLRRCMAQGKATDAPTNTPNKFAIELREAAPVGVEHLPLRLQQTA